LENPRNPPELFFGAVTVDSHVSNYDRTCFFRVKKFKGFWRVICRSRGHELLVMGFVGCFTSQGVAIFGNVALGYVYGWSGSCLIVITNIIG
jgi:hypothetical protein